MKYIIIPVFLIICFFTSCKETLKSDNSISEKTLYDVVFRENLAGAYEKLATGDKSFKFYYTYTDRGRGPEFSEEITLDEENFIMMKHTWEHHPNVVKQIESHGINCIPLPFDSARFLNQGINCIMNATNRDGQLEDYF